VGEVVIKTPSSKLYDALAELTGMSRHEVKNAVLKALYGGEEVDPKLLEAVKNKLDEEEASEDGNAVRLDAV
jgi:hypothetical protein